jgi:c-di-GMP phosphodiesterase
MGDSPAPAAAAPAAPPASLPASPPAAAATPPARVIAALAAGADARPTVDFGVQRPLVGSQGRVAGFECQWPPALAKRLAARSDLATLASHHALLLASLKPVLAQGRHALAAVPAALLARPMVADAVPDGAWLGVTGLADLPADLARRLRGRGVRLGVPDGPPDEAPDADFVWLRADGDVDALLLSAQRWQEVHPRLPRLATGLDTVDDVERLLQAGFVLAGGQLGQRRAASDRPLNAAAHRICQLMNHLAMNRDTEVVAEAVRGDVALTYRLLRYANSPALGLTRSVESVERAVLLLGRQELSRWLSMLLMSAAASRQAATALQEQALARGRLLELLARDDGEPAPETLFSLGLLSMLEPLLEMPLTRALAPLRLGPAATQALLQGQGPWAVHLQLVQALDRGNTEQAEVLAARWGGLAEVQALQTEAWRWASAVLPGDSAPSKKPVD